MSQESPSTESAPNLLPFDPVPSPNPRSERYLLRTMVIRSLQDCDLDACEAVVDQMIISRSFLRGAIAGEQPFVIESENLRMVTQIPDIYFDSETLQDI